MGCEIKKKKIMVKTIIHVWWFILVKRCDLLFDSCFASLMTYGLFTLLWF